MKRVFISQPMRDLSDKEILEERERIENKLKEILNEPFEIIDSFFENTPRKITPLWYLGKSIEKMSYADIVFFAKGWEKNRGCVIEHSCADQYGYYYIEEKQSNEV